MDLTMKTVAWLLVFTTLLLGCYSYTTLTPDSPQSAHEVSFRLTDGTYVLSSFYERIEDGYKVEGKWVCQNPRTETAFSGILLDAQIKEVVTCEFDTGKTVIAVLVCIAAVPLGAYLVYGQLFSN